MQLRQAARALARRAVGVLPPAVRDDLRAWRVGHRRIAALKHNQALLALRLAQLEEREGGASSAGPEVPDDRFPDGIRSRLCTQAQLGQPWFGEQCAALAQPAQLHRKLWEFAYIARALDALGMLEPGRRGVGFGVGREPLVSYFAGRGAAVLATDLDPSTDEARAWAGTAQHAVDLDTLHHPEVCDRERFRELVSWRPVDMRRIPPDLRGFDFCWSACALEHLGSLEEGLAFVEASLATLRPGGIAVHTTEFNVYSLDDTIEQGATVVYRERDLVELRDRLERQGHQMAALDLDRGAGVLDHYVDVPPHAHEPALRFQLGSHVVTSVALVVRARPDGRP